MSTHPTAHRPTPPAGLWFVAWRNEPARVAFDADSNSCLNTGTLSMFDWCQFVLGGAR